VDPAIHEREKAAISGWTWQLVTHVQQGLTSRAYESGRFSAECESGVHHVQSLVRESLARG